MKIRKTFRSFWKTFFHVQVTGFILVGGGIIFLTFLTSNNALEIAISAVASVFIGIGVNNFSTLETHERDRRKMNAGMLHTLHTLEFVKNRVGKLQLYANERTMTELKNDLEELQEFLTFAIHLMNEDDFMN